MFRRIVSVIFVALISFLPVAAVAQTQCIKPLDWRWFSNLAYDDDQTTGPGSVTGRSNERTYSNALSLAAPVYLNTDLNGGVGPNGEGKVTISNQSWGLLRASGFTRVWSSSIECTEKVRQWTGYVYYTFYADNHLCNGSTRKAVRAQVYLNDTKMKNVQLQGLKVLILHEVGHVFGMGHVPDSCGGFMVENIGILTSDQLNTVERNWINTNY